MSKLSEAIANADSGLQQLTISCPTCISDNTIVPRYMAGDPRNQAILIHEDGWASHATSKHSVAPITTTKACMSKLDRSANKNAQVYSFVPVDQLPKDSPHKLDAFFEPLITKIEDFIYVQNGSIFQSSSSWFFSIC